MTTSDDHSTDPTKTPSANKKSKPKRFSQFFWLAFLVVSLGYAWYSFYVPSNEVNWADDIASAKEMAAEADKPILMFFTAEWCVPCRIMKREVFADEDVKQIINRKLIPLMIYADDPGAEELFKHYNIGGTPITIITDATGNTINYAVGGIGKTEFLSLIEDR